MITNTGCAYYTPYGHTSVYNPLRGCTYYPQAPTVLFPPRTPTAPPRNSEADTRISEIVPWLINRPPTKITAW
jgi:hypothetical protein